MDHPYYFYLSLCYLQLNKFDSANEYMTRCITEERSKRSDGSVHYLHYFYYGLIQCELKHYDKAVTYFDSCLQIAPHIPDVQYYKALCLNHDKKKDEALALLKEAHQNMKLGYTINEDNAIYEQYPYQVSAHQMEYALKSFEIK
jgi:tetratricopeptide (TPR) repeat protein